VTTAGHGGIKLDAARNRKVPGPVRSRDGWYEEDCDWAIPAYVHDDIGSAILAPARLSNPDMFDASYIVDCLKRWQSEEELVALGIS